MQDKQGPMKYAVLSRIFTTLILAMPLLNCYVSPLPSVAAGEFALLLVIPFLMLAIIHNREKVALHQYWIFIFYGLVVSLAVFLLNYSISFYEIGKRLLRDIFYTCLIFVFAQKFFLFDYAIRVYKVLAIITCIYVVAECVSFYLFGYTLPWKIPGIDFNVAKTMDQYTQHYQLMYAYTFRPTSIFTEPAQFAQYAAPCLLLTLYIAGKKGKLDWKLALFISVALLLSTSANGYVCVLVIWGMWSLHRIKKYKNLLGILAGFIVIGVILSVVYDTNKAFSEVINRVNNIGGSDATSENLRLLRGFYFFSALDPIYQLFGIGFGSFTDFSSVHALVTKYDIANEYMSSLSYILVSAGLTGLILYLGAMGIIFKNGNTISKALVILLLVTLTSSSIYSEAVYVIMLSFALYGPEKAPALSQAGERLPINSGSGPLPSSLLN